MKQKTGILAVYECTSVDRNLHIRLSYHDLVIPLPERFQFVPGLKLNLVWLKTFSYLRKKGGVLSEFSKVRGHFKETCSECQHKLVATESGREHDDYLQKLSPGKKPNIALRDFPNLSQC